METKKEIFERYKDEYFKAKALKRGGRREQTRILDTVCEVTGIHRKSAARKFNHLQKRGSLVSETRGRPVYYTPDAAAALKDVWDASNGLCGELLHPMIQEYAEIFKRDGLWNHSEEVTGKLLAMSEMTVKRRADNFEKVKRKGQGFSSTSPSNIKTIIPISVGEWKDADPGVEQEDTVAHCGSTLKGDFTYTLNATDVPTLWNILRAQWNKGQEATRESEEYVRKNLPFPYLRRHTDTGGEFIAWEAKKWGETNSIKLTRSRPRKKNDNPHVEERNGHIVRKYAWYIRLDARETVDALNNLYVVLNLHANHFIASRKTMSNVRVGAKYKRTYEKAMTPYRRVLAHPKISNEAKEKLRLEHIKLNPASLLKEIGRLQTILYDTQRKHGNRMF
ncbi:MAG: hypothetical protein KGJ01_03715 [Patescibacteria group bacterium]|nr:hypothetical protein [Patescibacteria group bacterium]